ncbi:helix-turn-helix transcriptional regulator [Stenotrophomonas acidaminiphila]|uniref:helix-turn-helix domain-containing protein n=1 Tax=Stenotrophomonas acidaminiphila TaxID=128780 RepID=UPI0031BA4DD8
MSQRAYAEQIGVPLKTYQTYEQGKREPDVRTLAALYEGGWNLNWVLMGEGNERREALQDKPFAESGSVKEPSSQLPRMETLTLAVQLAEEALDGGKLGPADYGQLVALIHEALVNGLPNAQVLAFAKPAARGIRGSGSGEVGKSGKTAAG